jgi:hypothetical protein
MNRWDVFLEIVGMGLVFVLIMIITIGFFCF